MDCTELPQTGDLNRPSGPYEKAAEYLSRTYNSQKSFFLTCGATSGIHAMVLYAKKEGRTVVAARNSHMSVINACLMFGADCEIVEPDYSYETDSYKSPSDAFIKYLNTTKKKCAVIVTHPDYFGRCADMRGIRAAAGQMRRSHILRRSARRAFHIFGRAPGKCRAVFGHMGARRAQDTGRRDAGRFRASVSKGGCGPFRPYTKSS